jgi:hypothetical protein
MLRRHNDKTDDIFLETDKDYYTVNIQGDIFHVEKSVPPSVKQVLPFEKEGEFFVNIEGKEVRIANIVNFVFKNTNPDFFWEIMDWDIIYVDGNKGNLYPFNLSWNNTNIKDDEDGFRLIPGFTRYKINREGVIKKISNGRIISDTLDKSLRVKAPYVKNTICRDYDLVYRKCGKHRLLAYAYLPMPNNFFELDVSHLDCNPQNNDLSNLRWQSRRENNLQTAKQYLIMVQQPMLVYNCDTKEIKEYFSIGEMQRQLGIGKGVGEMRLLSRGTVRYPDGYAYMLKSDFNGEWPEVKYNNRRPIISYPIKVTIKKTGEVITYNGLNNLAKALGTGIDRWQHRLRRPPFKWEDESIIVEKDIANGKHICN